MEMEVKVSESEPREGVFKRFHPFQSPLDPQIVKYFKDLYLWSSSHLHRGRSSTLDSRWGLPNMECMQMLFFLRFPGIHYSLNLIRQT